MSCASAPVFSTIRAMNETLTPALPCPCPGLDLLHVDADCVVLLKPSGLHSVPGVGEDKHDSILTRLQAHDPHIHAVHRLDRDTSGVMVFGRHKAAISHLGKQFQARTVDKRYVALVAGEMQQSSGEIELAMRYAPEIKPRQVIDAVNGKPARTLWQVLERRHGCTLVSLEPFTGRTHQLRLHLQAIGHPILGDSLYAPEQWLQASPRLCLHACELTFEHPGTGQRMHYESPENFSSILS